MERKKERKEKRKRSKKERKSKIKARTGKWIQNHLSCRTLGSFLVKTFHSKNNQINEMCIGYLATKA